MHKNTTKVIKLNKIQNRSKLKKLSADYVLHTVLTYFHISMIKTRLMQLIEALNTKFRHSIQEHILIM